MCMNKSFAIAIDGPAAAGKSTVAKHVANYLDFTYIDTGAMYRALTLKALNNNISVYESQELAELLGHTTIQLKQFNDLQQVLLDDKDVTRDIRSLKVTNNVSHVAKHAEIRQEMVKQQQALAQNINVVMDGRDIGTNVLPTADLKVFLIASVEERAKRRYNENVEKGFTSDLNEIIKDIQQRDILDTKRKIDPLIKAKDAVEIDTTSLSIKQVVSEILTKYDQLNS